MQKKNSRKWIQTSTLITVAILLLLSAGTAMAALFTISASDSSVAEWSSQGIPIFITDPSGDVTIANEDILNTWVASTDSDSDGIGDQIYFLMQLGEEPALSSIYRMAVASIDCNGNGIDQEFDDRLILYIPAVDSVYVFHGDLNGTAAGLSADYGQRVGEYIEWGVYKSILGSFPDDDPAKPEDYCQGDVSIRFASADATTGDAVDQTDLLKGWNIPTVVRLHEITASARDIPSDLRTGISIIVGLFCVAMLIITNKIKTRK